MKATELRIGNLVQDRHSEECGMIDIVVLGIIDTMENHSYEPIPLTEDWLKRFGFEIKKGAWGTSAEIRIGRVRYVLYQNGNVWSINPTDGFRVDFKYIHTVQNHYFALTGQELNQNKEDE
tara:strand:- start:18316 stop:18678 length:363 start_codon:yes stop_codon:yes gene_type:complete